MKCVKDVLTVALCSLKNAMALPMVPGADFKQSLHLKAAVWQEPQGIREFVQPGDGYIFTQVSEDQKHQDRSVCLHDIVESPEECIIMCRLELGIASARGGAYCREHLKSIDIQIVLPETEAALPALKLVDHGRVFTWSPGPAAFKFQDASREIWPLKLILVFRVRRRLAIDRLSCARLRAGGACAEADCGTTTGPGYGASGRVRNFTKSCPPSSYLGMAYLVQDQIILVILLYQI